jgi:hypothetical protein
MEENALCPLIVGCLSLISVVIFSYIPLNGVMLKFRRELRINYFALGIYNLLLALVSVFFNIDLLIILYLMIGGIFVIGIITIIPVFLKIVKDAKVKKD